RGQRKAQIRAEARGARPRGAPPGAAPCSVGADARGRMTRRDGGRTTAPAAGSASAGCTSGASTTLCRVTAVILVMAVDGDLISPPARGLPDVRPRAEACSTTQVRTAEIVPVEDAPAEEAPP